MTTLLLTLALLLAPSLEVRDPAMHRVLAAATIALVAPREARALYRLAHDESRWTPGARSKAGAAGLWQQIPRWSRVPTSAATLATRPVHAALVAITTWRAMVRACGPSAHRCYREGPARFLDERRRGW